MTNQMHAASSCLEARTQLQERVAFTAIGLDNCLEERPKVNLQYLALILCAGHSSTDPEPYV
jgi:hypothetical protein